jgi:hypothetical protein
MAFRKSEGRNGEMKSGAHGLFAGDAMFTGGEFDESLDILRAPAAAAGIFQTEPGFDLAWHHDSRPPCVANLRIRDPFAQAQIHERLPLQERL